MFVDVFHTVKAVRSAKLAAIGADAAHGGGSKVDNVKTSVGTEETDGGSTVSMCPLGETGPHFEEHV